MNKIFIEKHDIISGIKSGRYMLLKRKSNGQYTVFMDNDDDTVTYNFDPLNDNDTKELSDMYIDFRDNESPAGFKFQHTEDYMKIDAFLKLWKRKMFLQFNE